MMQHSKGHESLDLRRTVSHSRSTSLSSDSQLSRIHLFPPPEVNPQPCFIASSAASQIITADQEFNTADFVAGDEDNGATASALVTPEALSALNGFLDDILFNVLAASKSTQLSSIRPAIAEVLKPRLAKEVVSAADDELSEYMGSTEDEQFEYLSNQNLRGDFDLIRSWKLTRLRCMVYTRLGDMEEDDEDEFIAQEGLGENDEFGQRFTSNVGNITPAAAIFLTSILEYIGEQALVIAGETARSRLSMKLSEDYDEMTESGPERGSMDRLVVEDLDMEKLALNPTLGRLWRMWRRRTRSPSLSRAMSRESMPRRRHTMMAPNSGRNNTVDVSEPDSQVPPATETEADADVEEEIDPASIALPMSEHDILEIEISGFSAELDGGDIHEIQTMEAVVAHKVRPKSLMMLTIPPRSPSSMSSPATPAGLQTSKATRHTRSKSLPGTPSRKDTFEIDHQAEKEPQTAIDEHKHLEVTYEHEDDDERIALNVSVQREMPNELEQESLLEENMSSSAVQEDVKPSTLSAAVEVVTSEASSIETSSASLCDQQQPEMEVIDGQEMSETQESTSVQLPGRTPSRDPPRNTLAALTSDRALTAVEEKPLTEGGDSNSLDPAVNHDTPSPSGVDLSSTEPASPQTFYLADDAAPSELSEESEGTAVEKPTRSVSASGDSTRSDRSRIHRPSPLSLTDGSQQQNGQLSPSLTTPRSAERAAVQRISRPPTSAASSIYSVSRRSDSFSSSREKHPFTAGSSASQVSNKLKVLINRQSDAAPARLSSDTGRVTVSTVDDSELDKLIESEETIHFTLTPKSMREMEDPDSPRWRLHRSDHADGFLRNTSPTSPTESESPKPMASDFADSSPASPLSNSSSPELPKSNVIQTPRTTSLQQRSRVGEARDAGESTGSTRDFANFIKSTGPDGPTRTVQNVVRSPRMQSRSNGPRLEARPAVIPKGDYTSDLIDFIREGPPGGNAHRIPRTVAPFRDSEELEYAGAEREGSVANRSFTSVGSRTALLDTTSRTSIQAGPTKKVDMPGPVRKQRRVRDPYAIDDSDDDELLEEFLENPKPKREEESLMDFLRNAPPPPESEPQPFISKNTSGGMKARLLRNTSFDKVPTAKSSKSSMRQQPENYLPGQSNYIVKVGIERNGGGANAAMTTMSGRQTGTSSLADFLRNTGPPEPPVNGPTPVPANRKDSSTISRLFVRRKKVEV